MRSTATCWAARSSGRWLVWRARVRCSKEWVQCGLGPWVLSRSSPQAVWSVWAVKIVTSKIVSQGSRSHENCDLFCLIARTSTPSVVSLASTFSCFLEWASENGSMQPRQINTGICDLDACSEDYQGGGLDQSQNVSHLPSLAGRNLFPFRSRQTLPAVYKLGQA